MQKKSASVTILPMDLAVQTREQFGRKVKALRKEGFIPAELYGHGVENLHLAVPAREFMKVFKEAGSNTVVNLQIGKELRPALIYDVSKDYMSGEFVHVDFYQVRMDEKINAKIPLEFVGVSPAEKEFGGNVNKAMDEVEVEALPADLPHNIEIDLSVLKELNASLYVRDLNIPKGVKVLVDPETVIVTVTPPVAEEEKVEEAPADVTAVKVETEEKKAEREEVKAKKEEK